MSQKTIAAFLMLYLEYRRKKSSVIKGSEIAEMGRPFNQPVHNSMLSKPN